MNRKEIIFNRERVAQYLKYSKEMVSQMRLTLNVEDYLTDELTAVLDSYLYTQTQDEKTISYYVDRPKFFDWLLRRRKRVDFTIKARDVLLNPPTDNPPTIRLYEINRKFNEA